MRSIRNITVLILILSMLSPGSNAGETSRPMAIEEQVTMPSQTATAEVMTSTPTPCITSMKKSSELGRKVSGPAVIIIGQSDKPNYHIFVQTNETYSLNHEANVISYGCSEEKAFKEASNAYSLIDPDIAITLGLIAREP